MPIGRAYQDAKRLIDAEKAATIILTTRCRDCDWQVTGMLAESQTAFRAHRRVAHRGKKTKETA